MDAGAVQRVRAFNRTVAERIGALTDGFLGRGRPMGESRTLWEIGLDGTEVRQLRARYRIVLGVAARFLALWHLVAHDRTVVSSLDENSFRRDAEKSEADWRGTRDVSVTRTHSKTPSTATATRNCATARAFGLKVVK